VNDVIRDRKRPVRVNPRHRARSGHDTLPHDNAGGNRVTKRAESVRSAATKRAETTGL
jgi:hypothetical protein